MKTVLPFEHLPCLMAGSGEDGGTMLTFEHSPCLMAGSGEDMVDKKIGYTVKPVF